MPSATASPCSRRSEKPAAASKAWPNVWPRLRSCRSPDSRSSRATIAALARQLVAIARRSTGEDLAPARLQPVEERCIVDQAVFRHLGVAGAELARRKRIEERG